jgi:polyhydroxyalkanoate synthesis regulator phasin
MRSPICWKRKFHRELADTAVNKKGAHTMELGEGIKKILLAGIGTAAVTAEKSKEVLDELVKKGELTVEQGKVLNQELKHNIKESVKKNVNVTLKPSNPDELKEVLSKMTPDQLAALKEQISRMQEKDVDAEEAAPEEPVAEEAETAEEEAEAEEAKEEYEADSQE